MSDTSPASRADYLAAQYRGRPLSELPTPCLLVDSVCLEQNLSAMSSLIAGHGKNLRAHAKTHKCSRLAHQQIAHGAIGICVAKLSEAEALIRAGIDNILITGPVVGRSNHERAVACVRQSPSLTFTMDDLENTRALALLLAAEGLTLHALLDLDIEFHRTGVDPRHALEFAARISEIPNVSLHGLQAYAGHVQHIPSLIERAESVRRVLDVASEVFTAAQSIYPDFTIYSVGGTGSVEFDIHVPAVTEIQAGSYVFMDSEYLVMEWGHFLPTPGPFPPALSLLTTVVSRPTNGYVTVDAGMKTLYRDGPAPFILSPQDRQLSYDWYGDEYGRLRCGDPAFRPPLGETIRLSASHCDPTINLHDFLFITEQDIVVDVWPIDLRGCSQ